MKYHYEVRQIEAWNEGRNIWTWNDSYKLESFTMNHYSDNGKKLFLSHLHNLGFTCKRGKCYVSNDSDYLELRLRKTQEPLFAMIITEEV